MAGSCGGKQTNIGITGMKKQARYNMGNFRTFREKMAMRNSQVLPESTTVLFVLNSSKQKTI
jgi:hypothetical protein